MESESARLDEVEHDLAPVVELLGRKLGEPFRSAAREIIRKQQTSVAKER